MPALRHQVNFACRRPPRQPTSELKTYQQLRVAPEPPPKTHNTQDNTDMRPTALSFNLISLSLSEGGWVGEVCGHMQHTSRSHSRHQPLSLSLSPITHSYTLPYDEISCCQVSILFFSKHTASLHSSMRSSANGVAGDRTGTSNGSGSVDKGVDFANYFCTYALLYHQKEMLCDRVRMEAYYNAVFENKHHFHGKTVLDVGTGSGILAIWAGQAGARKVYAVEATKMSEHARELVKANNLEDVVEVIEGSMEDVTLPEKVDVIISEWMGYFLLRESMFDSVICARDRWLKPTGVMYPSNARMWLAPIRSGLANQKISDYEGSMDDWFYFLDQTKTYYGVDMSVLTKPFAEEQKKYYLQTSLWNNLHPNQVIGTAAIIKDIDCLTATVNDILNLRASISSSISSEETRLCGFAGWFDVHFRGSKENPAQQEIELTTAPSEDYSTHWGQQVFLLHPPISVSEGDDLNINFSMDRSKENHRLMEVELSYEIKKSAGTLLPPFRNKFYIE